MLKSIHSSNWYSLHSWNIVMLFLPIIYINLKTCIMPPTMSLQMIIPILNFIYLCLILGFILLIFIWFFSRVPLPMFIRNPSALKQIMREERMLLMRLVGPAIHYIHCINEKIVEIEERKCARWNEKGKKIERNTYQSTRQLCKRFSTPSFQTGQIHGNFIK